MLYPTLNQPLVVLVIFIVAVASGVILDLARILSNFVGGQKFSRHFFDFLAVIFSFFLLEMANLKVNYGQFRIYVIVVFLVGLFLERILSKFLWTKLLSKCYTKIENFIKTLKLKGKHGRKQKKQT